MTNSTHILNTLGLSSEFLRYVTFEQFFTHSIPYKAIAQEDMDSLVNFIKVNTLSDDCFRQVDMTYTAVTATSIAVSIQIYS